MKINFPIVVKSIQRTCGACPAQWEGLTDDNRQIYVRYRWGYLSIRLGPKGDMKQYAAVRGKEVIGRQIGGGFDGFLEPQQLINETANEIKWPIIRFD